MKQHVKIILLLCLMFPLSVVVIAQSGMNITFDIVNSWNLDVHSTEITEAGSNYGGTYTSSTDQISISHDVKPPGQYRNHSWSISVNKSDANWNPLMELWIRRTGNGSTNVNPNQCAPSITGGNNYQLVGNTSVAFYSGRCQRDDVPIQLELRNVSVLTPADTYSTDIVYTITITVP